MEDEEELVNWGSLKTWESVLIKSNARPKRFA
jgi:hypothetical protein